MFSNDHAYFTQLNQYAGPPTFAQLHKHFETVADQSNANYSKYGPLEQPIGLIETMHPLRIRARGCCTQTPRVPHLPQHHLVVVALTPPQTELAVGLIISSVETECMSTVHSV